MVVTNSFPFRQTLIHGQVEFFQAGNAVDVVDGNPRQPGTVSAYASYPPVPSASVPAASHKVSYSIALLGEAT
jgi:hypothetical protein